MVNYDMDEIERKSEQYEIERKREKEKRVWSDERLDALQQVNMADTYKSDSEKATSDWIDNISDVYPDLIVLEERSLFNPCIVGVVERINLVCICYDVSKIIVALMRDSDMSKEEAYEHYEFNIQGSYMGEHSPVFLTYKMGDEHE